MLPILRTISVGGVLLAITILVLALSPPGRSRVQLATVERPARGPLIDRYEHPEWRQFLILSALRRFDEISKLRDLPDAAVRVPAPAEAVPARLAGLPETLDDSSTDDTTGSINVAPHASMPIEIGEPSSTELPVMPVEERPPVATIPSAIAPAIEARETQAAESDVPQTQVSKSASMTDIVKTVAVAPTIPAATPADTIKPAAEHTAALAPAQAAKPTVVVIRKHVVRRRAAKAAPKPVPAVPPPFNFFQALFDSFNRKPGAVPAAPIAQPAAKPVANPVAKPVALLPGPLVSQ